jgi:SAM-dependent methyltransferase
MAKHLSQGWLNVHSQFSGVSSAVDRHLEACYKLSDAELRADFTCTIKRITGTDADSLLALRLPWCVRGFIARDRNHGIGGSFATGDRQAQSLGLLVKHDMLPGAKFENDFFDVIRSTNMVEYPPDSKAIFSEIHRILKSNRIVYITAPNTRSLVFRLFRDN